MGRTTAAVIASILLGWATGSLCDTPARTTLLDDDHSELATQLRTAWTLADTIQPSIPEGFAYHPATRRVIAEAFQHYLAALRAADLTSAAADHLRIPLRVDFDWPQIAVCLHQEKEFRDAVLAQLEQCPERKCGWAATLWIRFMMDTPCWSSDLPDTGRLMHLIVTRQPHMLYHPVWSSLLSRLDTAGMQDEAATLAQAIVLAPPPEPQVFQDTPDTVIQASQILQLRFDLREELLRCALKKEPEKFVDQLSAVARQHNDNHLLIALFLDAKGRLGSLRDTDLDVAKNWVPLEKLSRALDLLGAVSANQPKDVFGPWLKAGLDELFPGSLKRQRDGWLNRALQTLNGHCDLLKSVDLESYIQQKLTECIDALAKEEDRRPTPSHFETWTRLTFAFGTETQQDTLLARWFEQGLNEEPTTIGSPEIHAWLMANLALQAPPRLAPRFADHAADLLMRYYEKEPKDPFQRDARNSLEPPGYVSRAVLFALLATSQHGKFGWLASMIEKKANAKNVPERYDSGNLSVVVQLRSLQDAILRRDGCLPMVVAWTRNGKTPQDPSELVWEFVAPLHAPNDFPQYRLSSKDEIPTLTKTGRGTLILSPSRGQPFGVQLSPGPAPSANASEPKVSLSGWDEGGGLRSPLLELLSGIYDLTIEAGPHARALQSYARIPLAAAHGSVPLPAVMPECGFFRTILKDRATGRTLASPLRLYSLEPPVLASGREPDGGWETSAVAASPPRETEINPTLQDSLFHAPVSSVPLSDSVPFDPKQFYVLTVWHAWDTNMDGSDAPPPPLDNLAIAYLDDHLQPFPFATEIVADTMTSEERTLGPRFYVSVVNPNLLSSALRNHPHPNLTSSGKITRIVMIGLPDRKKGAWPLFQLRPLHLPVIRSK